MPQEASPSSAPIAVNTCDGLVLPEEHADPDEIAIPARSIAINCVCEENPGADIESVPGSRASLLPQIWAPSASAACCIWSRIAAIFGAIAIEDGARSQASPSPAIAG